MGVVLPKHVTFSLFVFRYCYICTTVHYVRKLRILCVSSIKWYQNIWRYIMLEWAGATFVKIYQNPGLTGIGICFGCYQQNWESWILGLQNYHSEFLMTLYKRICFVVCIFCHMRHRHFMLHRAINYFIERFGYFLVCSVMSVVIINGVTHQKGTKTLNNVIKSSQHKMSMAYVVGSIYSLTPNKLLQNVFQRIWVVLDIISNILEVPQNPTSGKLLFSKWRPRWPP